MTGVRLLFLFWMLALIPSTGKNGIVCSYASLAGDSSIGHLNSDKFLCASFLLTGAASIVQPRPGSSWATHATGFRLSPRLRCGLYGWHCAQPCQPGSSCAPSMFLQAFSGTCGTNALRQQSISQSISPSGSHAYIHSQAAVRVRVTLANIVEAATDIRNMVALRLRLSCLPVEQQYVSNQAVSHVFR